MSDERDSKAGSEPTMELVVEGPTPAGGVRSRMVFVNERGVRVPAEDPAACHAVLEELDEHGTVLERTFLQSDA